MESLSSPSGEKLLISGWWGWLRNPNYLGEVIIHMAFIMTSGEYLFKARLDNNYFTAICLGALKTYQPIIGI